MNSENIRSNRKKYIKSALVLLIVIALLLFCSYQNRHLETTYYTYKAEQLGADLEGYRIVQISDLHNVKFGKNNQKLVDRIRECEPDMIVLTGDLVDSNHTNVDRAVQFVDEIVKICPVYYVTGNHEYWLEKSEYDELMDGLVSAGVVILDNQVVEISRGDAKFRLVGLDDRSLADGTLEALLSDESIRNNQAEQKEETADNEDSGEKELTVVLAHEPQYLARYAGTGVDLVLSGHAHGGQFRLPFVGGIVAPDQGFLPEYTAGEYYMNGTEMIVSRGLGNSVIPVRLFNYPEIVCVELVGMH
ncbi:metallophosphoesterase [Coprococcus eutactus]|uniref:metallophosphoesterase n=1 Tax=Coprococcus eutactus TaxID=33043 RepID=UPI00015E941B|nr:metallophosphoesterase [Coprococcus eutactus]EDP25639.1 Ser/Thr phosphatase family protein [Coprococcus eutactus ATCC 27759]UEA79027.1 metallophosphoesterase [Coprococcus eutactus ATCC 27759]UWP16588.1 metallophosphoesterase [Coprococcus eutactus]